MLLSRQFKLARVIDVKRGFNSFDLVRIPGDLCVTRLKSKCMLVEHEPKSIRNPDASYEQ